VFWGRGGGGLSYECAPDQSLSLFRFATPLRCSSMRHGTGQADAARTSIRPPVPRRRAHCAWRAIVT
jgi:hypothetical protein